MRAFQLESFSSLFIASVLLATCVSSRISRKTSQYYFRMISLLKTSRTLSHTHLLRVPIEVSIGWQEPRARCCFSSVWHACISTCSLRTFIKPGIVVQTC
jgi:hypothetical protein